MRARTALLISAMAIACHEPPAQPSERAAEPFVVPPALACVPRDYAGSTIPEFVQTLAEACENAQPLLTQPVLDAIARARYKNVYEIPRDELSRILLRAARSHPAYDWDCDIADEDAGKPWPRAGRPRACSELKKNSWLCVFDAGTGMWLDTLFAVAAPYPDAGSRPPEEIVPAVPKIAREIAHSENIMGNRCAR